MQSQTGRSIPDTGYTTINITVPLQYFPQPDLQVQQALTYTIQIIASPPVISQNKSIQKVTHDLTGSPGHKLVPYTLGETVSGTAVPTEPIAADVGNVMWDETEFSVTEKPKLTFLLTVAHSRRLGWAALSSFLVLDGLLGHTTRTDENERRTHFPKIITHKQNSGHAPLLPLIMSTTYAPDDNRREGKGRRGKNRSEYLFGNRVMARY